MAKKKFEMSFLIVPLVLAVVLTGYFFIAVKPYLSGRREISAEIGQKVKELELFRKEKRGITSLELIESLEAATKDYQKKMVFLKEYLGTFDVFLPLEVTQKGLFFKEKAYQTERGLREQAKAKDVTLPVSLGFDKDIPKEEEAEKLLCKLAVMNKVVEILIESGMDALISLNFEPYAEKTEAGIAYTIIPVKIKCRGRTLSLLNFVHNLTRAKLPLIIEKMDVKKASQKDKEKLDVNFTIQGICLQEKNLTTKETEKKNFWQDLKD